MRKLCVVMIHLTYSADAKSAPLGLVMGIQTWGLLGSLCFNGETSKGVNDSSNGEHHQRASDPKTEVR